MGPLGKPLIRKMTNMQNFLKSSAPLTTSHNNHFTMTVAVIVHMGFMMIRPQTAKSRMCRGAPGIRSDIR